MDMDTLQLLVDAGPNAASMVKVFVVSGAVVDVTKMLVLSIIGYSVFKGINTWRLFEYLSKNQQREYLQRKFKVGKPDEEVQPSDTP